MRMLNLEEEAVLAPGDCIVRGEPSRATPVAKVYDSLSFVICNPQLIRGVIRSDIRPPENDLFNGRGLKIF